MADSISIRESRKKWVVRAGGAVLGESSGAKELSEPGRDDVIYFPRDDVAMEFLEPSETRGSAAGRGEASFYSIQTKSSLIADAAWSYETPPEGAEAIAGHVAFDTRKVTVEEL